MGHEQGTFGGYVVLSMAFLENDSRLHLGSDESQIYRNWGTPGRTSFRSLFSPFRTIKLPGYRVLQCC